MFCRQWRPLKSQNGVRCMASCYCSCLSTLCMVQATSFKPIAAGLGQGLLTSGRSLPNCSMGPKAAHCARLGLGSEGPKSLDTAEPNFVQQLSPVLQSHRLRKDEVSTGVSFVHCHPVFEHSLRGFDMFASPKICKYAYSCQGFLRL